MRWQLRLRYQNTFLRGIKRGREKKSPISKLSKCGRLGASRKNEKSTSWSHFHYNNDIAFLFPPFPFPVGKSSRTLLRKFQLARSLGCSSLRPASHFQTQSFRSVINTFFVWNGSPISNRREGALLKLALTAFGIRRVGKGPK